MPTDGKKWFKIPKSKRKEIELRYFRHSTRLHELIILVCQNRMKNYQVMPTQRLAKSGRAAHFEPISGYFSHIFEDRDLILRVMTDGQTQF